MNLSGAEEGGILIRDTRTGELRVERCVGPGVFEKKRVLAADPESSLCAYCAEQRGTVYVANVAQSPRPYLGLSDSRIVSELVVPFMHDGECIGMVNLESSRPDAFSPEARSAAEAFCGSVSDRFILVITERTVGSLRQQLDAFDAILEAIAQPTRDNATQESAVIDLILNESLTLAGAETGGLLTLTKDGTALQLIAATNLKRNHDGARIPSGRGLVWMCLEQREPFQLNVWDVCDESFRDRFLPLSDGPQIRSALVTPLRFGDQVLGVINIESASPNAFGLEQQHLLEIFAKQAAIVLQLTQLERQRRGAWALANFGDLSDNLAHRMNNFVGGIRAIAAGMATSAGDQHVKEQSVKIRNAAESALRLVKEYRQLFQRDTQTVNLSLELADLVNELAQTSSVKIDYRPSEVVAQVRAPKMQIRELCREIIANAVKASTPLEMVDVSVTDTEKACAVRVADRGHGFPEYDRERLSQRGARGNTSTPGTGYGLWWAHQFLDAIGGELDIADRPGGGAVVTLVIPHDTKVPQ